jgi:hypothetical protein
LNCLSKDLHRMTTPFPDTIISAMMEVGETHT